MDPQAKCEGVFFMARINEKFINKVNLELGTNYSRVADARVGMFGKRGGVYDEIQFYKNYEPSAVTATKHHDAQIQRTVFNNSGGALSKRLDQSMKEWIENANNVFRF